MAKIDLRKSSGISLFYENEQLVTQDVTFGSVETYHIDRLRSQLLNNDVTCPDIFFHKYMNLDHEEIYKDKKLSLNAYVVMPNLSGIEYVKTKANVLVGYSRMIEVVYGGGILLMQCFVNDIKGDIIASTVKKGQKIIIPANYEFSISNTKLSPLILLEFMLYGKQTIDVLDDINGMSYYIIRKNAKQEIVRNPEYKMAEKPRKVNWEKILNEKSITSKTPLIKQILRKYEKFDWLFTPNSITI
jgi:oxalate decarboxylase/phosphoglucose isomerase-like protein (cupin superfamily)